MATKRYETCYTCRFWVGQGVRERGPKGDCRRYPPVVTARMPEGGFPVTRSGDWCGEWQKTALKSAEPRDHRPAAAPAPVPIDDPFPDDLVP